MCAECQNAHLPKSGASGCERNSDQRHRHRRREWDQQDTDSQERTDRGETKTAKFTNILWHSLEYYYLNGIRCMTKESVNLTVSEGKMSANKTAPVDISFSHRGLPIAGCKKCEVWFRKSSKTDWDSRQSDRWSLITNPSIVQYYSVPNRLRKFQMKIPGHHRRIIPSLSHLSKFYQTHRRRICRTPISFGLISNNVFRARQHQKHSNTIGEAKNPKGDSISKFVWISISQFIRIVHFMQNLKEILINL